MKVCILGATGGIGALAVKKALAAGHDVTVFVRSPEKVTIQNTHLKVVKGNLFDAAQLTKALEGQDAVLSTFGRRLNSREPVNARFAPILVSAMTATGVERLVYLSVSFLFRNSILTTVFGYLFFRHEVKDHGAADKVILESKLAWTIVRPPRFVDKASIKYRVRENGLPSFGFTIGREALAEFMVDEIGKGKFIRKIVGISS